MNELVTNIVLLEMIIKVVDMQHSRISRQIATALASALYLPIIYEFCSLFAPICAQSKMMWFVAIEFLAIALCAETTNFLCIQSSLQLVIRNFSDRHSST